MASTRPLPLTVLGGYLGAGKTTVLNSLLRSSTERLAVLVNDFGEIDIDSSLIASHDGATISLTNGCVCCSLTDGFFSALQNVRAMEPAVDHVIVEASGVADPLQVAQWGHTPGFRLNTIAVVVDADAVVELADDRRVGDTVLRQLEGADLLLLTKVDLIDDASSVREWLNQHARAPILDAPFGTVEPSILRDIGDTARTTELEAREQHAAHVSAYVELKGLVSDGVIDAAMRARPEGLVRAKGLLRLRSTPDRCTILHLVGHRHSLQDGGAWASDEVSRVVAIARPGTPITALESWLHRIELASERAEAAE